MSRLPVRRRLALGVGGALAVGVVALVLALHREVPALRDGRLIAHLPEAVEVPPPPPRVQVLVLRRLPASDGKAPLVVPFTAEPMRGLVIRVRLERLSGPEASAALFVLGEEQAAQLGPVPVRLAGSLPGEQSGQFETPSTAPDGTRILQRFDHLPPGKRHGAIAISGRFETGRVEIEEAEVPDARGPEGPALRPLVRRFANFTASGLSWRSGLVARPGNRYAFEVPIRPETALVVGVGHEPGSGRAAGRFRILQDGKVLFDASVPPDNHWHDQVIPLAPSGAGSSLLVLESEASAGAQGPMRGLWSAPRLRSRTLQPNVLLITVDALRADHVGAYGAARKTTPTLDALAALGTRFSRASSQAPRTWESIHSLFSGRYPANAGVRFRGQQLPPEVPLLPEALAQAGYETFTGTDLGSFPPSTLAGFDEAELVDDPRFSPRKQFPQVVERFARGAAFAWFHLENAHYPLQPREPGRFDPDYQGRFKQGFTRGDHQRNAWSKDLTGAEHDHLVALYDSSVHDADEDVRGLLAALDARGLLERTLVVITADHGEQIGEHQLALEHAAPFHVALHVPLIVSWPEHLPTGVVADARVELIDLFPTLAHLLGLSVPAGLDGRDLTPALMGGSLPDRPAFAETINRVFSLYDGDRHLLLNTTDLPIYVQTGAHVDVRRRELYDVRRDPGELDDLLAREPAEAQRLTRLLEERIAGWKTAGEDTEPSIGQAAAEALRQAGYLQDAPVGGGAEPPEAGR